MSAFLNTVAPKETNHNYKATENYCKPIKSPSGFAVSDKVTFILKSYLNIILQAADEILIHTFISENYDSSKSE